MSFKEELAKKIVVIEEEINEAETRLTNLMEKHTPEESYVMCHVMGMSERITALEHKRDELKKIFWSL